MKKQNTLFTLIALLLADLLGGIEVDLFMPSFPEIERVFQLSPVTLQLMMSVNMVGYCVGSLICGFLGDRYGPRKVILWTLLIFMLGSIFCVWAPNYPILVFGRLLQGLGMSGPVILAFVLVTHMYPPEQQAKYIGFLNGITNVGVAIAPVIGSYITAYAGWRGNFTALLILSIFTFGVCFWTLPYIKPDPKVHLSLRSYVPLLRSKLFWTYMMVIFTSCTVYWVFTSFSSLLYIEDLGVDIKEFGFYQGLLAASYALTCLLIPILFKFAHQNTWLKIGMWASVISVVIAFAFSLWIADNPIWITIFMIGQSVGLALPNNILWPAAVNVVPGAKSRASALLMSARLLFTGACLEIVGYFYNHTFYPIALCLFLCMLAALWLVRYLPEWKQKEHSIS